MRWFRILWKHFSFASLVWMVPFLACSLRGELFLGLITFGVM
jgi:hypothetical protein